MERWHNRVAVVTGAGSGIGKAIANDLIKAGLRVVALDLDYNRVDDIHQELPKEIQNNYYPRKLDVTIEVDVQQTFTWIEETLGGTDILVSNAGIVRSGRLVDMETDTINEIIDTNLRGYIYAIRGAYKSMKARNFNGHIVLINSVLGHHVNFGAAELNIYPPTKFAVTAINETLRHELRSLGTRIKTTSISPGVVRTQIVPEEAFEKLETVLQPEDISRSVMFAISSPENVQIHELTIRSVGEII